MDPRPESRTAGLLPEAAVPPTPFEARHSLWATRPRGLGDRRLSAFDAGPDAARFNWAEVLRRPPPGLRLEMEAVRLDGGGQHQLVERLTFTRGGQTQADRWGPGGTRRASGPPQPLLLERSLRALVYVGFYPRSELPLGSHYLDVSVYVGLLCRRSVLPFGVFERLEGYRVLFRTHAQTTRWFFSGSEAETVE